jgi:hypothetical protein
MYRSSAAADLPRFLSLFRPLSVPHSRLRQVAVKRLRAPLFAALTQADVEEFRREAYMMSR